MCSQVKVMQYQREKPITNDISLGFENNFFNSGRYKIKHSKFLSEIRTARYIKILFLLSIDYFQFFFVHFVASLRIKMQFNAAGHGMNMFAFCHYSLF
jgi:hypothetical protein